MWYASGTYDLNLQCSSFKNHDLVKKKFQARQDEEESQGNRWGAINESIKPRKDDRTARGKEPLEDETHKHKCSPGWLRPEITVETKDKRHKSAYVETVKVE